MIDDNVNPDATETRLPFCGLADTNAPYLVLTLPGGPMIALRDTLLLILNIAQWIIIAHIIMSWLINFQVLNLRQPLVAQIWNGLTRLLEPIYGRIRNMLPNLGGLDLAPLIVLIAIFFLQRLIVSNAAAFY